MKIQLNFKNKLTNFINFLRSQPHQKRSLILQASFLVVLVFLLLWWMMILKTNLSENPVVQKQGVINEKTTTTKHSSISIFKSGLYLTYQDYIYPFLSKIEQGILLLFSGMVGMVIKISQTAGYIFRQAFIQYKSYVELVISLFK